MEDLLAAALAAHEAGGEPALASFLAAQPQHAPALRAALDELRRADLLEAAREEPETFGEFRVLGRLGSGGMGVVHLARQSTLDREVALKVVRPELLLLDGARERFRREIETVARLEHPAIVPILATGEAHGVPWYAMPRLRGRSGEAVLQALAGRDPATLRGDDLRAVIVDAAPVPAPDDGSRGAFAGAWWQACARCVLQAARGIQHAHARGVLHRDLKPSNLMLLVDGRAVVLDFGLAQAEGDARLTRTGSAAGSPAYMAPEQLRAEPADVRTDVYGLGATLHALLGLMPPFPLGDPQAMRTRIARGERQPLRAVPPELALVLATAMDVDRARRYASAGAFADDLQAAIDGQPIRARALPLPVRLRRFAERHRALVAAAGVALVFAAATPLLLLWQSRAANVQLRAAVDVSLDAVDTLLARVAAERVRNVPAMQRVAVAMLEDALVLFDRLAADGQRAARLDELRRRALSRLAHLRLGLGEDAAAAQNLHDLLAMLPAPSTASAWLDAGGAHELLAFVAMRTGRLDDAQHHADSADTALTNALQDPTTRTDARNNQLDLAEVRASLQDARGHHAAAIATLRAGIDAGTTLPSSAITTRRLAALRIDLAGMLDKTGVRDEALRQLDAVVAMFPDPTGAEFGWPVPRAQLAQAKYASAAILAEDHDDAAAQARYTEALDLLDTLIADYPEDPTVRRLRARAANQVANARNTAKDFAGARNLLESARADVRQLLAKNPQDEPAQAALGGVLRALTTSLRGLADWPALEATARALAALPDGRDTTGRAARELLRCAENVPARADALRQEAIGWLQRAVAAGFVVNGQDPLYAPLRADDRFRAVLSASPKH